LMGGVITKPDSSMGHRDAAAAATGGGRKQRSGTSRENRRCSSGSLHV
jgi:hypothetical protein